MPHCDCGFDFAKAHPNKRQLVAYALIPQQSYRAAIRREYAIVVEKNPEQKLRMIAKASRFVGSLTRCPRCGSWLLDEPRGPTGFVVLRKTKTAADQTVLRTGINRFGRKQIERRRRLAPVAES